MKFREMCESDLNEVLEVERNAYSHPWTEGNFRDCLNDSYEIWLLSQGKTIVGHGIISAAVGEAHLLNLCVAKGFQGQGLGRHILRFLAQRARDLDAETMFLEVRESNVIAQSLYRSEGYRQIGTRKNYYPSVGGREHAVVMSLGLSLDCYS